MQRAGATLCCGAWASHRGGFSFCGARALGVRASVVVAHGLSSCGSWAPEHRLSSCGARAYLLRGMWDLPGPGLEPVSPALTGGFLTTAPPGKPSISSQSVPWVRFPSTPISDPFIGIRLSSQQPWLFLDPRPWARMWVLPGPTHQRCSHHGLPPSQEQAS